MTDLVQKYCIGIYGWTPSYAKNIAYEYERFMNLRSQNDDLSPPNDIDKFWHGHILHTKLYAEYSLKKYKKFIHHNPNLELSQKNRYDKILNTLTEYIKIYEYPTYPEIWKSDQNNLLLKNCKLAARNKIMNLTNKIFIDPTKLNSVPSELNPNVLLFVDKNPISYINSLEHINPNSCEYKYPKNPHYVKLYNTHDLYNYNNTNSSYLPNNNTLIDTKLSATQQLNNKIKIDIIYMRNDNTIDDNTIDDDIQNKLLKKQNYNNKTIGFGCNSTNTILDIKKAIEKLTLHTSYAININIKNLEQENIYDNSRKYFYDKQNNNLFNTVKISNLIDDKITHLVAKLQDTRYGFC